MSMSIYSSFVTLFLQLHASIAFAELADRAESVGLSEHQPASGLYVAVEKGFMIPYQEKIPGTDVEFDMIPVPGGVVRLSTTGMKIVIDPMWVGKTEVTWRQFGVYTRTYDVFKGRSLPIRRAVNDQNKKDAVTSPTPIYEPSHHMKFGVQPNHPAVTMTPYAAKQYTKWLSKFLGRQYRIPSEAEWEFFSRAGTETRYSFGDDPGQLPEYACFLENNAEGPDLVGSKKPNGFGLHDVHGSVWEWVVENHSQPPESGAAPKHFLHSIQRPTKVDGRIAKGGGFMDSADRCTIPSRILSNDDNWKDIDPDFPKSPWWFTTDPSRSVGMRVVRSLHPLSDPNLELFWEADHPEIERDVSIRLKEQRGAIGLAVPELADDLKRILYPKLNPK